jgi:hypothetical protein
MEILLLLAAFVALNAHLVYFYLIARGFLGEREPVVTDLPSYRSTRSARRFRSSRGRTRTSSVSRPTSPVLSTRSRRESESVRMPKPASLDTRRIKEPVSYTE